MSKPTLVFVAPILTRSGYGEHARDILQSLIELDRFDISVISINWGDTPMNALDEDNALHQRMLSLIRREPLKQQPDIWMQCTVPNEFNPIGKYNIGITAGIEVDVPAPEWLDGCNRMDLVIVPSEHAKRVFTEASYQKFDKATNQPIGELKLQKPIEVLFEGVRTDVYNKDAEPDSTLTNYINETVQEDFAFLFVGHWLKGEFGQDRKDVGGLIASFIKTFAEEENKPALILKSSSGTFSITDHSVTMKKIEHAKTISGVPKEKQPNIYLIHGDLTEPEMNTLYNHEKVKALVSFTKGEGYGRPIAEFITSGKPVLVSGWSGHVDFVNPAFHKYLDGSLTPVHDSAVWEGFINKGSNWFSVDYKKASDTMKEVYHKYKKFLTESKKGLSGFVLKWSYDAMVSKFGDILDANVPKFATKQTIKLPTLVKKEEVVDE